MATPDPEKMIQWQALKLKAYAEAVEMAIREMKDHFAGKAASLKTALAKLEETQKKIAKMG